MTLLTLAFAIIAQSVSARSLTRTDIEKRPATISNSDVTLIDKMRKLAGHYGVAKSK